MNIYIMYGRLILEGNILPQLAHSSKIPALSKGKGKSQVENPKAIIFTERAIGVAIIKILPVDRRIACLDKLR
jgi:hypothetical protein